MEANVREELLREYGIADVITKARNQVIDADEATIERSRPPSDIIWKSASRSPEPLGSRPQGNRR